MALQQSSYFNLLRNNIVLVLLFLQLDLLRAFGRREANTMATWWCLAMSSGVAVQPDSSSRADSHAVPWPHEFQCMVFGSFRSMHCCQSWENVGCLRINVNVQMLRCFGKLHCAYQVVTSVRPWWQAFLLVYNNKQQFVQQAQKKKIEAHVVGRRWPPHCHNRCGGPGVLLHVAAMASVVDDR